MSNPSPDLSALREAILCGDPSRAMPALVGLRGVAGPQGCTPLHSNSFAPDEASLPVGIGVLTLSLLRWMERRP